MIKIGKIGIISEGEYKGWEIVVEQLNEAYVVAYWSKDKEQGYDDYYHNYEELEKMLAKVFSIKWTDEDYVPRQLSEEEKRKVSELQILAKKRGF